jgi:phage terminase large subunit GpA-like protein
VGANSYTDKQRFKVFVETYLKAFDNDTKKVKDFAAFKTYFNNVIGKPYEMMAAKLTLEAVSQHRRRFYKFGEVPNNHARKCSGSEILFLTMSVDVQKDNLAVAVMGWTKGFKCYLVDYFRLEDEDCRETTSKVWLQLQEMIDDKIYAADDGKNYKIALALIDSGYSTDTVNMFCRQWDTNVFPILGRDRPSKYQKITEFAPFTTKIGTQGYKITVDHYKDRLSLALNREWVDSGDTQKMYHFNAPFDITEKQLNELTKESKVKKVDPSTGFVSYIWKRKSGADNELWDLLVYGHAAVEIIAWEIAINQFGHEKVDMDGFWTYLEEEKVFFSE